MRNINENEIKKNLIKKEKGIRDYVYIMQNCNNIDDNFQRAYKRFYKLRRNSDYCKEYFNYLKDNISKKDTLTFEKVIKKFYKNTGRIEASFSSKLLATINPNMAIWDKKILYQLKDKISKENISINKTNYKIKGDNIDERIKNAINVYEQINDKMIQIMLSDEGKVYIKIFNETYEKMFKDDENILKFRDNISNIKKLDFVLWSLEQK